MSPREPMDDDDDIPMPENMGPRERAEDVFDPIHFRTQLDMFKRYHSGLMNHTAMTLVDLFKQLHEYAYGLQTKVEGLEARVRELEDNNK